MGDYRYKAFISYSHADEAWGGWLQRSLETFRAPKGLSGVAAEKAAAGLKPVFRDREDLPAAGSLNAEIQKAIAESEHLVVICSPNAARSPWVNEEIKLFKRLHGGENVLALIADGEPGDADRECFPEALRFAIDDIGDVTATPVEPLAADAREIGDGKRAAFLKIAAGLLGVRLDELVRRDAQRRAKRMQAIAASAIALVVVMSVLTAVAVNRSAEAQRMRVESENLIEFMLTDLRDKLEPVGRLDVLESVGSEAMAYYDRQNLKSLDGDSLNRRAEAMLLLGKIELERRNFGAALGIFLEAEKTTAEQLRRAPNDPERIFDHAQSVFYVGDTARVSDDLLTCEKKFGEYFELAKKLLALDAANPKWRLEFAYATSNLGIVEYEKGNYEIAIGHFDEASEARRILFSENAGDESLAFAYAYALSWRAFAELSDGQYSQTIKTITAQLDIYAPFATTKSENYKFLFPIMTAHRRKALAHLYLGEIAHAKEELDRAIDFSKKLLDRETQVADQVSQAGYSQELLSQLKLIDGDTASAVVAAELAIQYARDVFDRDPSRYNATTALIMAIAQRLLVPVDDERRAILARELAQFLAENANVALARSELNILGRGYVALAGYHAEKGEHALVEKFANSGIRELGRQQYDPTPATDVELSALYYLAGDLKSARSLLAKLEERGIKHPQLVELRARIDHQD